MKSFIIFVFLLLGSFAQASEIFVLQTSDSLGEVPLEILGFSKDNLVQFIRKDKTYLIWNKRSNVVKEYQFDEKYDSALLNPMGNQFLLLQNGVAWIVNTENREKTQLERQTGALINPCYDSRGNRVLGLIEHQIYLWDCIENKLLFTVGNGKKIASAKFDGQDIIVASTFDNKIFNFQIEKKTTWRQTFSRYLPTKSSLDTASTIAGAVISLGLWMWQYDVRDVSPESLEEHMVIVIL